ncbi:MAG: type II secretion system protein GspD [Bacillota bacterium]
MDRYIWQGIWPIILFLLISLCFSGPIEGLDTSRLISFKDTEIKDILYTIASVNELNIIVLDSVQGQASLQLDEEGGAETLERMIIATGHYYLKLGEIYYVGTKEEIEAMNAVLSEPDSKRDDIIELPYSGEWQSGWGEMIESYYPELQWGVNVSQQVLILQGEADKIATAAGFLEMILLPGKINSTAEKTEIVYLPGLSQAQKEEIDSLFSESIYSSWLDNSEILYLEGPDDEVERAGTLLEQMKLENQVETRVKEIEYRDPFELSEKISLINPDISAVPVGNNIFLKGKHKDLEVLEEIMPQLDNKPEQIMVEFAVFEVTQERQTGAKNSGDNYRAHLSYNYHEGLEIEFKWEEFLTQAEQEGGVKTIASPSLLTLVGFPARLHIGDKIALPVQDEENNLTDYNYLDAGIILEVTSWVNSEKEITLKLNPEISTATAGYLDSPVVNTKELSTMIRLQHGETYYIGGLRQSRQEEGKSSWPVLENIPLLGWLFTSQYHHEYTGELVLAITPYIVAE